MIIPTNISKTTNIFCSDILAEREGFEPSIVLPLYTLSKRAD